MWSDRWRMPAVATAVAVVVAVAVWPHPRPAGHREAAPAPGWQAFPGTFGAPAGTTADVVSLVRERECFSAVGTVRSGGNSVIASWTGSGDCRRVAALWPTGASHLTGDERVVRVVDADGTDLWHGDPFVVIAGQTGVLKGHPGGWIEEPFPSGAAPAVPAAAGPADPYLLVAGRRGPDLVVWRYSGFGWDESPLPGPADAGPADIAPVPGGDARLIPPATVVVGHAGGQALVWHSPAGGVTWQLIRPAGVAGLTQVVSDGSGLVATGTAPDGGPVVLTSADGVDWRPDTRTPPAGPVRALFVLHPPADPVVRLGGPPEPPPPVYAVVATGNGCASFYRRDPTAWVEEPLGCDGVPTSMLRLTDGRLAAAGGTTLWLRPG